MTNRWYLVVILMLLLTGCGGGSSGVASGPGTGTGGTGIASVTGFSSVTLNDDREFTIDENTQILIDDLPATETELRNIGVGMMALYEVAEDVDNSISSGTLKSINAGYNVIGPVTSVSPLQVLGQTVVVTGDTLLSNVPGNSVAHLYLNDQVEVSGFDNASNTIYATLIRIDTTGSPVWRIKGNVSNVIAGVSFTMGKQLINLNGVVPQNCGAGLTDGDYVVVKALEDSAFMPGNTLNTVTLVECRSPALIPPANPVNNVIVAQTEGLVTARVSSSDFEIRGQPVLTVASTVFEGGAAEDVLLGARLEAEGKYDVTTGILTADRIRFRQQRVRIEAPVTVAATGVGSSFTMLDVITVNTTALTDDDDSLTTGPCLNGQSSCQVEVRGFVDIDNKVYAQRIRDRGPADADKVRLRGPASDACDPAVTDVELGILGVNVDAGDPGTVFVDSRTTASTSLPDLTALCGLISVGTAVQVEDGKFSSIPAARIDDASQIEIEN